MNTYIYLPTTLIAGLALSASASAGEINLKSLQVKNPLKAGVSYEVRLPYRKKGKVRVVRGCFTWSGEGPYCFPVNVRSKTIRATLRTNNPNIYNLGAYIEYQSGGQTNKTNQVFAAIDVRGKNDTKRTTLKTSPADVKCVQRGLLDAGHDPRGVDGKIGGGTKKAAHAYSAAANMNLPKLDLDTAPVWCRQFRSAKAGQAGNVAAGNYRAVFTSYEIKNGKRVSVNRCAMLEVDYEKGHFYRYGVCNDNLSDTAEEAKVWATGLVTVSDKQISVLQAQYELLEAKPDKLVGNWKLGSNPAKLRTFVRQR